MGVSCHIANGLPAIGGVAMKTRAKSCHLSLVGTTWHRFPENRGDVAMWRCDWRGCVSAPSAVPASGVALAPRERCRRAGLRQRPERPTHRGEALGGKHSGR